MISPSGMALAAMTVMLWILWSDSFRKSPHPIVYAVRVALFIIVGGVLTVNMVRMPRYYPAATKAITIVTVVIAFGGAIYFARKLVRR
jgi:hypothetical protein